MKKLPIEFQNKKWGISYKQVRRTENNAIYALHDGENGQMLGYEVHRISRHNGFELGGNFIEPAEQLASTEQFGTHGFYYAVFNGNTEGALGQANTVFEELELKAAERKAAELNSNH